MQLELFETEKKEEYDGTHKECYVCNEVMPWTKDYFGIAVAHVSGKVHLKGLCKTCDNEHRMVRYSLRKKHLSSLPDTCDCCGRHTDTMKENLHLDHSYVTKEFRGWICGQCNRGIGNLGETVEGLEKAIAYLRRTDGQS